MCKAGTSSPVGETECPSWIALSEASCVAPHHNAVVV